MISDDFRKERAQFVRDLADRVNNDFMKKRLLGLVERYEGREPQTKTSTDLQPNGFFGSAESER